VPPPRGTCGSCGGAFFLTVPEAPEEGAEVEVELAPWRAAQPSPLEAGGLRGPIRWAVFAGLALVLAFLVLGVLFLVLPDTAPQIFTGFVALSLLLVAVLVGLAGSAALVVRLVLGRRIAAGRSWPRSVKAVLAGIATLALGGLGLGGLSTSLGLTVSATSLSLMTLAEGLLCVAAGWITARLAPGLPYRHALCVALVPLLDYVGVLLLTSDHPPGVFAGGLVYALLGLPPLLLGARLGRGLGVARA